MKGTVLFGEAFSNLWCAASEAAKDAVATIATDAEQVVSRSSEAVSRVVVSAGQAVDRGAEAVLKKAADWKATTGHELDLVGKKLAHVSSTIAPKVAAAAEKLIVSASPGTRPLGSPSLECSVLQPQNIKPLLDVALVRNPQAGARLGYASVTASGSLQGTAAQFQSKGAAGLLDVATSPAQIGQIGVNSEVKEASAEYSLQGGTGLVGGGVKASASASVLNGSLKAAVGPNSSNPLAELDIGGKFAAAEASADALMGDDGTRVGFAQEVGASASLAEGSVGGEINFSLGWIPLVPKDWTISIRTSVSGGVGSVGATAGVHGYYDRDDQRAHAGGQFDGALGVGIGLDLDVSIGKAYQTSERSEVQ